MQSEECPLDSRCRLKSSADSICDELSVIRAPGIDLLIVHLLLVPNRIDPPLWNLQSSLVMLKHTWLQIDDSASHAITELLSQQCSAGNRNGPGVERIKSTWVFFRALRGQESHQVYTSDILSICQLLSLYFPPVSADLWILLYLYLVCFSPVRGSCTFLNVFFNCVFFM